MVWPGAVPADGEVIDPALKHACAFLPEREWRILGDGTPPAFRFDPEDVAFVVVGDWNSASRVYPSVRIDRLTGDIDDPTGVWLPSPERLQAAR
jgi:hypothetical protein